MEYIREPAVTFARNTFIATMKFGVAATFYKIAHWNDKKKPSEEHNGGINKGFLAWLGFVINENFDYFFSNKFNMYKGLTDWGDVSKDLPQMHQDIKNLKAVVGTIGAQVLKNGEDSSKGSKMGGMALSVKDGFLKVAGKVTDYDSSTYNRQVTEDFAMDLPIVGVIQMSENF